MHGIVIVEKVSSVKSRVNFHEKIAGLSKIESDAIDREVWNTMLTTQIM